MLQSITQAFESFGLGRSEVDGLPRVRIEIVELETTITVKEDELPGAASNRTEGLDSRTTRAPGVGLMEKHRPLEGIALEQGTEVDTVDDVIPG